MHTHIQTTETLDVINTNHVEEDDLIQSCILPAQKLGCIYNSNPFTLFTFQATSEWSHIWLSAFYLSLDLLKLQTSLPSWVMEKVQYLTRSAIRRASTIEMPQQARQNLQNLFINFCLILICLLLICIIVMLLWSSAAMANAATYHHQLKACHPMKRGNKSLPK